jgi:hypothetical protein
MRRQGGALTSDYGQICCKSCQRAKSPKRACNGVTENIRASGISRQRRETLDSPQIRYVPRSYGAQSARFILDSRLPTSAPAQMQSAPLPAAMMTDENARCNVAMDGAGHVHSEPRVGAMVPNTAPSSVTPTLQPHCYKHPSPSCNL